MTDESLAETQTRVLMLREAKENDSSGSNGYTGRFGSPGIP
jgi:hypothetical protein